MPGRRIGFVSTRFAGTDGVSLEAAKWAKVFWDNQDVSFWFSGKSDRDPRFLCLSRRKQIRTATGIGLTRT